MADKIREALETFWRYRRDPLAQEAITALDILEGERDEVLAVVEQMQADYLKLEADREGLEGERNRMVRALDVLGEDWAYEKNGRTAAEARLATTTEALNALDRAARYYREALKHVIEECGHDEPRILHIYETAARGKAAADHELGGLATLPGSP
jgi:23S rRNA G2069 N7-methylase RlmK/C1962 C5-methylase RlmI